MPGPRAQAPGQRLQGGQAGGNGLQWEPTGQGDGGAGEGGANTLAPDQAPPDRRRGLAVTKIESQPVRKHLDPFCPDVGASVGAPECEGARAGYPAEAEDHRVVGVQDRVAVRGQHRHQARRNPGAARSR